MVDAFVKISNIENARSKQLLKYILRPIIILEKKPLLFKI